MPERLTGKKKAKLFEWFNDHREALEKYPSTKDEIAELIRSDLGFKVGTSTVTTTCEALDIQRKSVMGPGRSKSVASPGIPRVQVRPTALPVNPEQKKEQAQANTPATPTTEQKLLLEILTKIDARLCHIELHLGISSDGERIHRTPNNGQW